MKKICSVILAMTVFAGCIKERYEGADLKTGDMIPDFEVVMNDGSVVTDDILKESVSVIMFFHTSCKDCQQVLPSMQKIYDEYMPEGVSFAVISREEKEQDIRTFWNDKGLEMPYSAQKDRNIYELFAKERIPRIYICEKGGIIRHIYTDDPNPSYDNLKLSLEDIIR